MFNVQYLFLNDEVYSPWMSREGDSLRFTLDVIAINGTGEIDVEISTKNSEDPGAGSLPASGSVTINSSTVGRAVAESTGNLDELVRYRFTGKGTATGDYVLFRMLAPVWFNDVSATV